MKGFLLLMTFMTRLYIPKIEHNEEKLGKAMKFFPFIGAIIGTILFFTTFFILYLTYNMNLTVISVLLIDVILSGAIHLDGLADTFDGIFSYRSRQKMLEIMKDSRIGTNGVLALIMYFFLKFFLLLAVLQDFGTIVLFFIVFTYPIVARMCSVVSCASAPYARTSGMGKTFVDNTNLTSVIIAFISTILLSLLPFLWGNFDLEIALLFSFIVILLIMVLLSYLFSKLMTRKIGGITGDTLGALLELSSVIYILLFLITYYNLDRFLLWEF